MPEPDDLALLTDAAHRAGELALRFWRHDPEVREKPKGAGPVSEADLAVDALLRQRLLAARPDHGWLSEETPDSAARLAAGRLIIVDPIDGTRAFVAGEESWAVAIAVAEAGRVVAGVVHLPAKGLTYAATADGPATLNGDTIRVVPPGKPPTVLANKRGLDPTLWPGGTPEVERHFRPSLAWRLALVAEGRFDAMLTLFPVWDWDIAAGSLIAERAGATVTDKAGQPLAFNRPRPLQDGILAATPALHAGLLARLRPADG